jgi:hypothetical protein
MQFLHASDRNRRTSSAGNSCTHGIKKIGKIDHLWFASGAFDQCNPFGERRSHHYIGCAKNSRARTATQEHRRAHESPRARMNISAFDGDFGSKRFETLEVQINGPRADYTTTWQGHGGFF